MADSSDERRVAMNPRPLPPLPMVLLISLAGIVVAVVAVFWVASFFFIPETPKFSLDSAIGTGGSQQPTATLTLTARNPNKRLAVAYDGLEVAVHADPDAGPLFGTMVPPFVLEAKSQTTLLANFSVVPGPRFLLWMQCGVHFEARHWEWFMPNSAMQLKVFCGELLLSIPTSPRVCRVDGLLGRYYS